MGIQDRDWYKEDAKKRFQSSPSEKAQRESDVRSKFEQYTRSFSTDKGRATGRKPYLTYTFLWLGVGAFCFALITWLSAPKVTVSATGVEVVIPKAQDGHHYIDGLFNGKPIRFLIDTGASYVSIGGTTATQLGLGAGKSTRFETANGPVIGHLFEKQSIQVSGLAIPPLTVAVMPNAPNTALLGQNFLRHVELIQVDNKLVLRGRSTGRTAPSPRYATAKIAMYTGLGLLFLGWLSSFLFDGPRRF